MWSFWVTLYKINVGNVMSSILTLPLLIMAKEKKFTKKSKANLFCQILINVIIHVHIVLSGRSSHWDKMGGDSHPDPEIRGAQCKRNFFSAFWISVWSKNKRRGGGGVGVASQVPPLVLCKEVSRGFIWRVKSGTLSCKDTHRDSTAIIHIQRCKMLSLQLPYSEKSAFFLLD